MIKRTIGITGNAVWPTPHGLYYWNGPGARLYLLFGDVANPSMTTVDDSRADGNYKTTREAETALKRYLAHHWGGAKGRRR